VGAKSRGNWRLDYCLKIDCLLRDKISENYKVKYCDFCLKYSLYEREKKHDRTEQDK
jgi:hypothetical protein